MVVPDNASADARSSRLGYQALRGTGIAADVVVCSQGYFEARTCKPRCPEPCFARVACFMPPDRARIEDTQAWLSKVVQ